MKATRIILLMLLTGLLLALGSCSSGGGDGDTTGGNPDPNPGVGGGPGGDDPTEQPPGRPVNPFGSPFGAYGDLRGIAASREFVYVADETNLYCFDKLGNFVNTVAALNEVQGLATFPATLAEEIDANSTYFLANCPIIIHNPVAAWGYMTIYAPGLDPAATREDVDNPDARRIDGLPGAQMNPPNDDSLVSCVRCYDVEVDRYGSVICQIDMEVPEPEGVPELFPTYPRTVQILSRFDDYVIQDGGTFVGEDENGDPTTIPLPGHHRTAGFSVGDFDTDNGGNDITPDDYVNLGHLAVNNILPPFIPGSSYDLYVASANFLRDYVGIASVDVDDTALLPEYSISPAEENGFGFQRIIGGPSGGAPGSFSPFANPGDPDTTQGGPSGMSVDPRTNELYVCDPGNARIQIFNEAGALVDILTGFTAPTEVAVDMEGNVFVCDVDQIRTIYRTLPDAAFGNVGGTVFNSVLSQPLSGALVQLRNSAGTVFETEVSNINGDFLFQNLPIGDYFIGASKFNYASDFPETTIQVLADTTVRADFNLEPLTGSTNGQYVGVVNDIISHLPVDNVEVQIAGTSLRGETDITGRFVIDSVPAGTYQVLFIREGYETLTKDITILRGNVTTDNNIRLTPIL